jgi:outer membrane protein
MQKELLYILLLLFLLVDYSLFAQQKWTLNQCISYAIENNINLKAYEIDEKISEESWRQSKRELLPSLSASSSMGLSFGRSVDPNTNSYVNTEFFNNSYGLSSSITVFDGFNLQNQIKYQKFLKEAAEHNRLNAIDNLAFSVMTAFFDVVYYRGMLIIANEQVEISKLSLKTTEKKVELGLKAKTDLLDVRANLESEELNKIQIENYVQTATLELKQLMNYSSVDDMELENSPTIVLSENISNPQELFTEFTMWSPYFKSIETGVKATEKRLAIYRSYLYPSISVNGSVSTGFYETNTNDAGETIGFSRQIKDNRRQYLGASLSIPIFNQWSYRSNIKEAKLELASARNNLENEKQNLFFDMITDLTELEACHKEYNQYVKSCESAELAFKAAEKKFHQGLISINDYYIAKNRLANTQSEVLRSRTQWEIKMKTIEFYRGQRFWENK